MRTRFCATIRRPACSIMALTAPVRLRAVASGLMIEKVRSSAIVFRSFGLRKRTWSRCAGGRRAYSRRAAMQQATRYRDTEPGWHRPVRGQAEFGSNTKPERQFIATGSQHRREPLARPARPMATGCDEYIHANQTRRDDHDP